MRYKPLLVRNGDDFHLVAFELVKRARLHRLLRDVTQCRLGARYEISGLIHLVSQPQDRVAESVALGIGNKLHILAGSEILQQFAETLLLGMSSAPAMSACVISRPHPASNSSKSSVLSADLIVKS